MATSAAPISAAGRTPQDAFFLWAAILALAFGIGFALDRRVALESVAGRGTKLSGGLPVAAADGVR